MNAHNWLRERDFGLVEAVQHIWIPERSEGEVAITALASACLDDAVIGLESALWVMRVLKQEPKPVQLVLPRKARASRRKVPAMEFHWGNSNPEEILELKLTGIAVRAHTPVRALIDVLRARPQEQWPSLKDDLSWASALKLFSEEELLKRGAQRRALRLVNAWLEAQKDAKPAPAQPAEAA